MQKLHTSHTAAGHCVVKLEKGNRWNVAAVAKDNGSWALSITGRTGFPLVQAKFHDWGVPLGLGPHIPQTKRNGTGYWRGKSGFNSEQAALDELLMLLGQGYHF
jgi:hypothetical protein